MLVCSAETQHSGYCVTAQGCKNEKTSCQENVFTKQSQPCLDTCIYNSEGLSGDGMAGQAETGGKLYGPPLTTKYESLKAFADFDPSDIPHVKPAEGSTGLVRAPAPLGWQVCTAMAAAATVVREPFLFGRSRAMWVGFSCIIGSAKSICNACKGGPKAQAVHVRGGPHLGGRYMAQALFICASRSCQHALSLRRC